jgi:hypothetical protein
MLQEGEFNPREYPKDLDEICGNELALKVKIQTKAKMCNVLNFRDNAEIIKHIKDQIKLDEVGHYLANYTYHAYPPSLYF